MEIVRGRLERGGAGLLVEGSLGDESAGCLVDTGATVNMLSLSWWRTHGEPGTLRQATEQVYSVEGRPLQLFGTIEAKVLIGKERWEVPFQLSEIPTDAILGSRFLRESGFKVDLAGERLLRETFPEEDGLQLNYCRVISSYTTVIQAGEEAIVAGYMVGDWDGGEDGLIEGVREVEQTRGLLVGRALVDTTKEDTLVHLQPWSGSCGGVSRYDAGVARSCRMYRRTTLGRRRRGEVSPDLSRGALERRDGGTSTNLNGRRGGRKERGPRRVVAQAPGGIPVAARGHGACQYRPTPNTHGEPSSHSSTSSPLGAT